MENGARLLERPTGERDAVEITYATTDSPFGELLIAMISAELIAIGLPGTSFDRTLARLAEEITPRIYERPGDLAPVRSQLDEYFEGRRRCFDLALNLSPVHGFKRRALDRLISIPYGHTATYAEIAAEAGSPRAHRAAGTACATNPLPIVVPCHRVLPSGDGLGGYGGGLEMKRALLELEQTS